MRQDSSARRAGDEQSLGEVPWVSRATAIKPDVPFHCSILHGCQEDGPVL